MRNMKYVVLTSMGYFPEYGGVENSIRFLSKELILQNVRPIVVAAQSKKIKYKKLSVIEGVLVVRFRFRPFDSKVLNLLSLPCSILSLYFSLKKIESSRDVVKCINRNQFISFFAQLIFKCNVYLAPGFSQYQTTPAMLKSSMPIWQRMITKFKSSIHQWFDKRALLRSKDVFVFSKNMKKQAKNVLGQDYKIADNFKITKPGVDSILFSIPSNHEKLSLRRELNLPLDKKIVLSVGRFVSAKGFEYLAESAGYLSDDDIVVIVGDGPEKEYLSRKYSDLCNSGKLVLVGSSDDTARYYKAADVFVLSSVYEPLGQTLLEAGACGLPIISFSESNYVINATAEIFSESAYYADDLSASSLALKICDCLKLNDEEYSEVSSSVRNEVLKSCSWRKLSKELMD